MGGGEKRRKGSGTLSRPSSYKGWNVGAVTKECNLHLDHGGYSEVAVQKGLKDAYNATGILSLRRSKSHRHSEVKIVCCHGSGEFFQGGMLVLG